MTVFIRDATAGDGPALSLILNRIIAAGGSTAHLTPFDPARMYRHYIAPPRGISCLVACEKDSLLGFQALERCDPNWPGEEPLPADWAVIASFVAVAQQGRGIGHALFKETRARASAAGIPTIDATIRADNSSGVRFYDSLGFGDYAVLKAVPLSDGTPVDRIRKRYDLPG